MVAQAVDDLVLARAREIAESVPDPELPMVDIGDLGMVRDVRADGTSTDGAGIVVVFTPTYSGCPATDPIQAEILAALNRAGFANVRIEVSRSPAWSTDRITDVGRQKLRDAGIAPPTARASLSLFEARTVPCPLCGSLDTERLAEHGSTPCKALYRCLACREPFDHFKCH